MHENKPESPVAESRRLPYQPPDVDESAVFETLAQTCGKIGGDASCIYVGGYDNS
jgi:hypothetical protein